MYAIDLKNVAEFLDIPYTSEPKLAPAELIDRIGRTLKVLQTQSLEIPFSLLRKTLPDRDRTIESLINHTVAIVVNFLEVCAGAPFDSSRANAEPDWNRSPRDLRQYIEQVKEKVENLDVDWSKVMNTYYGEQSLHSILERCAWHCIQHIRQLEYFMKGNGVEFTSNITPDLMIDLPLPDEVWDQSS